MLKLPINALEWFPILFLSFLDISLSTLFVSWCFLDYQQAAFSCFTLFSFFLSGDIKKRWSRKLCVIILLHLWLRTFKSFFRKSSEIGVYAYLLECLFLGVSWLTHNYLKPRNLPTPAPEPDHNSQCLASISQNRQKITRR